MAAPIGMRYTRGLLCKTHQKLLFRLPAPCLIKNRSASITAETITVPQKIHRSETALLEELSSTVKKDFHGPHYKFMDDPYLIPHSALEKRSYSLSRASGQKAAQYVLETFPQFLSHDIAEPSIPAFLPPKAATNPVGTEAGILERISLRQPVETYDAYQQACQAGVEVSPSTIGNLMELLCAHNSENPGKPIQPLEQFHLIEKGADFTKKIANTWQSAGFAEKLFAGLDVKDAQCYNALIRGRAKFMDIHRTYELFEEARQNNIPLHATTYTAILGLASFLREKPELCWDFLKDNLAAMAEAGLAPTLATFNNVLYSLSRYRRHPQAPKWAMQVINEMKAAGIEPSLGTWYSVAQMTYWHEDAEPDLLVQIVQELQGKDLTYRHPTDLEFFSYAMARCNHQLKDMELAQNIEKVLNHGNNIRLIGNAFKEGVYYSNFIRLLCVFEQIDTIMEHYTRVTPHAFTPTLAALEDLLRALDLNDGYQYLPQIWSDFVLFDQTRNAKFVEMLLELMGKKKQDQQLQSHFLTVAKAVKSKVADDEANPRLIRPLTLTGPMVGHLIRIGLNTEQPEFAWDSFSTYLSKRFQIEGFPSEESLVELSQHLMKENRIQRLMNVLEVMSDLAYPKFDVLVNQALSSLELTELQREHLKDL